MKFSSLAPVKVETARAAAEAALRAITATRAVEFEKAVASAMQPFSKRLWGTKVFRTREQAEKYTRASADGLESWQIRAWGVEEDAKQIIAACRVAHGGTVYLSFGDATLVSRHQQEEPA